MNSSKKIIIAAAVFGIVGMIFSALAMYPVFQGVVKDHERMLEYKRELAQIYTDAQQIQKFQQLSLQYRAEFERLETLRVDLTNPIEFFKFLDDTARNARVTLQKIPGTPRKLPDDAWSSLSIQLSGTGMYSDVITFLQKLENSPYLAEFGKVSLNLANTGVSGVNQKSGSITFSVLLNVFTK